jgi:phosphoribosylanthranilate isomerase
MTLEVIPAIDVSSGSLTRLGPHGPVPVEAFGGDPFAAARAFAEAGTAWIHVVDVDAALTGAGRDLDLVSRIAGLGVRVQAGGGIASRRDAEMLLSAGAARAVLGSRALADRPTVERMLDDLGASVVVGLEVRGARIRPRGDRRVTLDLADTLRWLAGLPVPRVLHTGVARVGGLEGPDLAGVRATGSALGCPVIAAGGIRGVEDLHALAELVPAVEGAVIGRALYEGVDLVRARAAVS